MQKRFFIQLAASERNCGMLRFSRVILADALKRLNVMAFEFKGYSAHICSIETFFHYNMEMLDIEKRDALFNFEGRRISTNRRDSLPAKYGKKSEIKNSIIADGCQIDGTVIDSVICRNVRIGSGTVVKNCILQDDTMVGKNATLEYVITDRLVIVSEGRGMMGYRTYPVYIERSKVV
jgi:glucose-1-phosphate adenylyltransferase